jgi:hypothetical protein
MESREGGAASLVWRYNWGYLQEAMGFLAARDQLIELSVSTEPRQILSPSTSAVLGAFPGTPCSLVATRADWPHSGTAVGQLGAACR